MFCNDNNDDDDDDYIISSFRVNLALAYTELTEELGRLQALCSKQTEILRKATQEPASPGRHLQHSFIGVQGKNLIF